MTKSTHSRRDFLRLGVTAGVAAAGAAALTRLSMGEDHAPAIRRGNLEALSRSFDGRIIQPGEAGYVLAASPNNSRWADVLPAVIAQCVSERDVKQALDWAKNTNTPFAVRSGGHSYAGFSSTPGMLISLRSMNSIELRPEDGAVTIGAGVNNGDMASALRRTNLSVPTGRCPTVGASGLVLGGGWGFSATHSGLTCDSLLSSRVVLPSGELVTASPDGDFGDLFWGLCGGGGGNFGVNTSFTFRLHEVNDVTVFNVLWLGEKQEELWMGLQKIQLSHPTQISMRMALGSEVTRPNPLLSELGVGVLGQFFGAKEQLVEILQPLLDLARPVRKDIRSMSYWQARDYLITDDPHGLYDVRSNYVADRLSEDAIQNMLRWAVRWPGASTPPTNLATQLAMGGKVRERAASETAYVHRNANFVFFIKTEWSPADSEDEIRRLHDWQTDYYADMQKYVLPQSYVNFPSEDISSALTKYYGDNLERLKTLKQRVDPENIFRFPQSIPLA